MRRYIVPFLTCFFIISLFLSCIYAEERLWVNYFKNYYYDSNSISCKNKICIVSILYLLRPNELTLEDKPDVYIRDTRYTIQLDCKKKFSTNSNSVTHRLSDGTAINEKYKLEWLQIKPKSQKDKLFDAICPGDNPSHPVFKHELLSEDDIG